MPCFRSAVSVLCLCMTGVFPALLFGSDWPRWRGPDDTGSTSQGTYPESLNEDTMLWKMPLPGKGCSTPIVVNQTIYVTAPVQGRDALLAIDWTGKQLWQTVFDTENAGKHRNGSGCNASAVSDGKGVFVYFKSGTLACVNLDGSVRWKTNIVERFGSDTLYWDHGTSPVLTGSHVILARMHNGESWVAAFDKQSGEIAWKTARNYQTPQEVIMAMQPLWSSTMAVVKRSSHGAQSISLCTTRKPESSSGPAATSIRPPNDSGLPSQLR